MVMFTARPSSSSEPESRPAKRTREPSSASLSRIAFAKDSQFFKPGPTSAGRLFVHYYLTAAPTNVKNGGKIFLRRCSMGYIHSLVGNKAVCYYFNDSKAGKLHTFLRKDKKAWETTTLFL